MRISDWSSDVCSSDLIWCSTFLCLYGNPHRRVPAKPRKRIRACARRRKSGLAVLRFNVKPHPCIIGFVGLPTMPQPLATVPERAHLLANGEARAAGQAIDPVPVVRLVTPDAPVHWPIGRASRRERGCQYVEN